jgi:hypothetical protein
VTPWNGEAKAKLPYVWSMKNVRCKTFVLFAILSLVSCDPSIEPSTTSHNPTDYLVAGEGDQYTYYESLFIEDKVSRFDTITYDVRGLEVRGDQSYRAYYPAKDTIYLHEGPATRALDTLLFRNDGSKVYRWDEGRDVFEMDMAAAYVLDPT